MIALLNLKTSTSVRGSSDFLMMVLQFIFQMIYYIQIFFYHYWWYESYLNVMNIKTQY